MAVFRGITWKEVGVGEGAPADSPIIRIDENGMAVTRIIDVAWQDYPEAIKKFIGYTDTNILFGGAARIQRTTPHAFDPVGMREPTKNKPWVFCVRCPSVEHRGWHPPNSQNATSGQVVKWLPRWDSAMVSQFEKTRLTLEYESLPYEVLEDQDLKLGEWERFTEKKHDFGGEIVGLKTGYFKWLSNGAPINATAGRVVPFGNITYTWKMVPGIPDTAAAYIGTVNNALFDTYPAETLLLTSVETPEQYPPFNYAALGLGTTVQFFDIIYHFRYDPNGHNYKLRMNPANNSYKFNRVSADGTSTGKPPYALTDFTKLFGYLPP